MTGHPLNTMKKRHEEYFTPKWIIELLGVFDLDPCAGEQRPFDIGIKNITFGGTMMPWQGRVFVNPPYGRLTQKWIQKLANHGNGIALIFSRTETSWFHKYIWDLADSIFFFNGRITFTDSEGMPYPANSGAPSCLIAYGKNNTEILYSLPKSLGKIIILKAEFI